MFEPVVAEIFHLWYFEVVFQFMLCRVGHILVNMALRNKIQKSNWPYFSILSKRYFMQFIHRSNIYRDIGVAAFLTVLQGWMFGPLGWSSGPAKLVGWPLQLKSGTAADFTCKPCLKNKTQRQSHLTLGYFWVQYHFLLCLLSQLNSTSTCFHH